MCVSEFIVYDQQKLNCCTNKYMKGPVRFIYILFFFSEMGLLLLLGLCDASSGI